MPATPPFPLPDEDRTLSPHTGWTRAHWEAVADGLLLAALCHETSRSGADFVVLVRWPDGTSQRAVLRADGCVTEGEGRR
ncbi:hypothetical protein DN069_23865 [Streptacidiphilus pinicola]|uniref:Uncharacterized protein n=1 Tax=Streptacidiphilus pinicola TaxID=2219663 RepID=A0A2X0IHS6_9ACTN|nr:hypothetical protein [Streptacidiphilus pinicola]RAG83143.1 hypothetical protein DN069_23865 [Streptacidiphilus pinicola]